MTHNSFHIDVLVILLMIAATVCMTVKWIKLPYSIALVLVGLTIGIFEFLPKVEMTPELIMVVCLPALLFEASWNIHIKELKAAWKPVTIFATIGVVVSTAIVGFILQKFAGVESGPAYLLGAMLSATDPISVVALFKQLGVDRKLTVILEGESLFNDGTAVVLFNLILAAVLANTSISVPSTGLQFITVIVGGAGVGCALGVLASKVTSFFDDHLLEITLTTILAYGSYLTSEHLHVSPVIAVVCAGIVMGNYGSRKGMSPSTRLAVDSFWEYAAFVVNSLVFLLIGLQMKISLLSQYVVPISIAIASVLAARILAIYGLSMCFKNLQKQLPWAWRHILAWGGLRGALCMALALSIPHNFPERELIIVVSFGVVLFTLLIPGLSMESLVAILKLSANDKSFEAYRGLKARLAINTLAMEAIKQRQAVNRISDATFSHIESRLISRNEQLVAAIRKLHLTDDSVQLLEENLATRELLELQKDHLLELVKTGNLNPESAHKIAIELDQEQSDLS